MVNKPWKATERHVAKRLRGRRVGTTGEATADVVSNWLAVEVKTRKTLPKWLLDAVGQAVAAASIEQLPIVILHQVATRHDNDIVVMRLADFEEWFGGKGGGNGGETG